MSKFLIRKRGDGKTTYLIKEAAKEGLYIICRDRQRAESIVYLAQSLGYDIPFPITLDEILFSRSHMRSPIGRYYEISKGKVLVDDVDSIMQKVSRNALCDYHGNLGGRGK